MENKILYDDFEDLELALALASLFIQVKDNANRGRDARKGTSSDVERKRFNAVTSGKMCDIVYLL